MNQSCTPAAQYLRMSTDHQQYSLENQADAIRQYASEHGLSIVKTYSDAAKSGLRLNNRLGLKQLLRDVVGGQKEFRAVLVYDVSRWGRFQDMDEAAHYEYLCKSSGVPIHYCAEVFLNDNSISGTIIKAIKRTMAGEYSRELSAKVRAGLCRLGRLGYKLGGPRKYGLRRQLLDVHGRPKQFLADGERKSVVNERVIYAPGPPKQIAIVQRIFQEFVDRGRNPKQIAQRLNADSIPYMRRREWKGETIRNMLRDTHYIGMQVWGRASEFLAGPRRARPIQDWVICPNAFEPIISEELFQKAQAIMASYTCRLTNEQLLQRLRRIQKLHGNLNGRIIDESRACPGLSTYVSRFGGLLNVYAALGLTRPELAAQITTRQQSLLLRKSLIDSILEQSDGQFEKVRQNGKFRWLLRYRKTGRLVSVTVARRHPRRNSDWLIDTPKSELTRPSVVALLDATNSSIEAVFFVPVLPDTRRTVITMRSPFLRSAKQLNSLSDLASALNMAARS